MEEEKKAVESDEDMDMIPATPGYWMDEELDGRAWDPANPGFDPLAFIARQPSLPPIMSQIPESPGFATPPTTREQRKKLFQPFISRQSTECIDLVSPLTIPPPRIPPPMPPQDERTYGICGTFQGTAMSMQDMMTFIVDHFPVVYCIVAEEVGKTTGNEHLQFYIQLRVQKTFGACNKIFRKAAMFPHLEKAKGSPLQNKTYCSKDGVFVEFGKIPDGKGHMRGMTDRMRAFLDDFEAYFEQPYNDVLMSEIQEAMCDEMDRMFDGI